MSDIIEELQSDWLETEPGWRLVDQPTLDAARNEIVRLRAEIERLRARVAELERAEGGKLKTAAREFLTTVGAAIRSGEFDMQGSADMCLFVRQAMQKLDHLAFDRDENPVGLERLHEEIKP